MYVNGHVTLGPWGGQNGARWDDGIFSGVRQVVIGCGDAAIDSIQIEYDKSGVSVWSDKHGGSGGFKIIKVKLNYPDESLVLVSGYCGNITEEGPVLVRSLVLESNNKTRYGPFGIQQGTHFSIPMAGGMIVGFHGRSSRYLDSIGVHLRPPPIPSPPNNFTSSPNYASYRIITHDKAQGSDIREKLENMFVPKDKVVGDNFKSYQPEILIHKDGYYGSAMLRGTTVVKSLAFPTNGRTYGPFGNEQGISFTYGPNSGVIPRLPARNGRFVDHSIGAHIMGGKPPVPPRPSNDSSNMPDRKISQVYPGMVKEPTWFSSGPWGGTGGKSWDDGVFSGVKKIFLFKGEAIYSIQVEYDINGQSFLSARHGGGSEGTSHTIAFQRPLEVLASFCGYYESLTGDESTNVIMSLTFFTDKGKYGPFGEETGTFFASKKSEGKIVGFFGKSGCYLNAIGVHMQL